MIVAIGSVMVAGAFVALLVWGKQFMALIWPVRLAIALTFTAIGFGLAILEHAVSP